LAGAVIVGAVLSLMVNVAVPVVALPQLSDTENKYVDAIFVPLVGVQDLKVLINDLEILVIVP
jgi:hypothetical protein